MLKKSVVLAFVASLVFFSSQAHAAVVKLKFANYTPPTHMNSVLMGKYCDELNKRLKGKVEVTQYSGGTLLSGPKMASGVQSGIADMGLAHLSYSRGRFPVMEVMELPLGFPSAWIASHVATDFYDKFKPKEFDNFHVVMLAACGPNVVQTLKKPVRTFAELQGMKIRGTGRIGDTVKALGAVPMPIEMIDLYEALRRGVVDGNVGPIEQNKGWKIGEVQKYTSETWKVGSVFQFYVVMNKRKWNSLPRDVQNTITEVSKEYAEKWGAEWSRIDIEGKDFFVKQGGQVIPVADAEQAKMVKAVQPVVAEFKKDLVGKGFKAAEVDAWLSFVKERIEYWKGQEKARKIPTVYKY